MSILNIQEINRDNAKIVVSLAGVSGSGKTFTAILLAYGMAKRNARKVGFLDTENRRGKFYADILPDRARFLYAELTPPFSPARYSEAIREFEKAGVEVLVIDSASHEWEGIGGCEEIATDGNPRLPRWNKAKAEHKKFMNVLLQSSMHIIVCVRAREKVKMSQDAQGKSVIEPLGLQPIQEKNFMFEMFASLMMNDMGRSQTVLKCPDALRNVLGRGKEYLGIQEGEALRAWIDGGTPVDKEVARWHSSLLNTCEEGSEALRKAWETAPKEIRQALKNELEALKRSAAGYDAQRKIAASESGDDSAAGVNAALAGLPPAQTTVPATQQPKETHAQKPAPATDNRQAQNSAAFADPAVGQAKVETSVAPAAGKSADDEII